MCLTSSKFTSLVHSCTSWDLYFEDEDEDNADKLARFSSAVKIIKSLKLSYNLDVDYDGPDSYDDLNEDDFYKFLRNHPEIKSMNLRQVNSEILGYIGHFCTDLRKLRLEMTATSRTSFRLGFNKLDTLVLQIAYNPKRKNIDFCNLGIHKKYFSKIKKKQDISSTVLDKVYGIRKVIKLFMHICF